MVEAAGRANHTGCFVADWEITARAPIWDFFDRVSLWSGVY
jgi:hypothetical protein